MSESPRIDVTGNDDDDNDCCRGTVCGAGGNRGPMTTTIATAISTTATTTTTNTVAAIGTATTGNAGAGGGRDSPAVKSSAAQPYTSFSISSILSKDKPNGGTAPLGGVGKPVQYNCLQKNAAVSPATAAAAVAAAATFDVTAHLAAAADHAMLSR